MQCNIHCNLVKYEIVSGYDLIGTVPYENSDNFWKDPNIDYTHTINDYINLLESLQEYYVKLKNGEVNLMYNLEKQSYFIPVQTKYMDKTFLPIIADIDLTGYEYCFDARRLLSEDPIIIRPSEEYIGKYEFGGRTGRRRFVAARESGLLIAAIVAHESCPMLNLI